MVKGYLLSAVLLLLGLAGVGSVALQASQSLAGESGAGAGEPGERVAADPGPAGASDARGSGDARDSGDARRTAPEARRRAGRARPGSAGASAADAGAAAPPMRPAPDAAAPTPGPDAAPPPRPDAAAPLAPDAATSAAPATAGPPTPPGPAPVLVLTFDRGSSRPDREHRKKLRQMVREHGYKDVYYEITAYAGDKRDPDDNRLLARRRCRWIYRLIHKRGPSRRWLRCQDPIYRKTEGPLTRAHRAPAWRRVEIRTKKQ